MNRHKVLVVDDEPHLLSGVKDILRKYFNVYTAESATEGLKILAAAGPFSVVISDMRMPEIDGAQFLTEVRAQYESTIRILLTGQADAEAASRAVNEGGVYRFLAKPCPPDKLIEIVSKAVEDYQTQSVESDLLKTTLFSSVEVMTEVLSLVNPVAFSRAGRLSRTISKMTKKLGLKNTWQYEIAALLSQLGCVTLPPDLLEKVYTHTDLDEEETELVKNHPEVSYQLLHKIPRLEDVATMVRNQNNPENLAPENSEKPATKESIIVGARLLYLAGLYEDLIMAGASHNHAIEKLHKHFKGKYGIQIDALSATADKGREMLIPKNIHLSELAPGMVFSEDIFSDSGMLLMAKGQRVSQTVVGRLMGFHERMGVKQPFRVLVAKK